MFQTGHLRADEIVVATRFDALERHDPPDPGRAVDRWRTAAFVVASVLWVPASAVTCFVAFIGVFGLGSENGDTPGVVDDPTSASAIAALGVAAAAFAVAFAILLVLARWAWPERQRRAVVAAAIALGWAPTLGIVVAILPQIDVG